VKVKVLMTLNYCACHI